jgi:hypothetical protein
LIGIADMLRTMPRALGAALTLAARTMPRALGAALTLAALTAPRVARAQPDEPETPAEAPPPAPAPAPAPAEPPPATPSVKVTPLGYVEAYYAYNFNRPSNGITNFRGFDNRHDTFSLQNVALGATWETGPVGGKLVLQVGALPSTIYAAEPALPGASGANASNGELWKYLQEAFLTYKAPIGNGILFQLGLCASPVGYEYMAVKDNWNWSRSNAFVGLPFYHTGLRATYELSSAVSVIASVFNGWNSIVDNNEEKSVEGQLNYKKDAWTVQALYFGGIERTTGSPEGPYWRHEFDGTAQLDATDWLSFAAQADYGWEPNRFGTARWYDGVLYAKVKPHEKVYVAVRADRFWEQLATRGAASSAPIFWSGAEWVAEETATIAVQPAAQLSIRLEVRHDQAETPIFFRSGVAGDGSGAAPFVANAKEQNTILLGATAWF